MGTLVKLFLFFTLVPLVELTLLLLLADKTNWMVSLGLVIVTGVVGAWLARTQGVKSFRRVFEDLRNGRVPTDALADSALILIAGTLLLTPGMLTDVVAITILLPWTRPWYRRRLANWFRGFKFVSVSASSTVVSDDEPRSQVIDSYVVHRHDKNAENGTAP